MIEKNLMVFNFYIQTKKIIIFFNIKNKFLNILYKVFILD